MKWIEIKHKVPPDKNRLYLFYAIPDKYEAPLIIAALYKADDYGWSPGISNWVKKITHWMPLPEPPKIEEK